MRKSKFYTPVLILLGFVTIYSGFWCINGFRSNIGTYSLGGVSAPNRSGGVNVPNISANTGIPNDYVAGAHIKPQPEKSYTVMVYMNGSDLESEYAAATNDISEMAYSGFDEENVNLLIFTGGCKYWHTEGIPNSRNSIFLLKNKQLHKLADADTGAISEPEVFGGFIKFGREMFPAKKYGIILWNHGGGAVVGYGSDEMYEDTEKASMKLSGIKSALASAGVKFEFFGFDTCLMSTLEVASIVRDYASYLVASEEVEPEYGWNYSFLREIRPESSGFDVGKSIIDYYAYSNDELGLEDFATLSMTDLSKTPALVASFEAFASVAGDALESGKYDVISRARRRTRSFGSGGEDGETDMIDIYEMALRMNSLFPEETDALVSRLNEAVVYNYENYSENTGGLSIYFPYANKENLDYSLNTYKSIYELPKYTKFISNFGSVLNSRPRHTINRSNGNIYPSPEQIPYFDMYVSTWQAKNSADGKVFYIQVGGGGEAELTENGPVSKGNDTLTALNGHLLCLYSDYDDDMVRRYTAPITLNGADANLIVIFSDRYPNGEIVGAIPTKNDISNMLDKKLVTICEGDKIAPRYYIKDFDGDDNGIPDGSFGGNSDMIDTKKNERWFYGKEFTVKGNLVLETVVIDKSKFIQKIEIIDTQNNSLYYDL